MPRPRAGHTLTWVQPAGVSCEPSAPRSERGESADGTLRPKEGEKEPRLSPEQSWATPAHPKLHPSPSRDRGNPPPPVTALGLALPGGDRRAPSAAFKTGLLPVNPVPRAGQVPAVLGEGSGKALPLLGPGRRKRRGLEGKSCSWERAVAGRCFPASPTGSLLTLTLSISNRGPLRKPLDTSPRCPPPRELNLRPGSRPSSSTRRVPGSYPGPAGGGTRPAPQPRQLPG